MANKDFYQGTLYRCQMSKQVALSQWTLMKITLLPLSSNLLRSSRSYWIIQLESNYLSRLCMRATVKHVITTLRVLWFKVKNAKKLQISWRDPLKSQLLRSIKQPEQTNQLSSLSKPESGNSPGISNRSKRACNIQLQQRLSSPNWSNLSSNYPRT